MNLNKNICNLIDEYTMKKEHIFRYPNLNNDEFLWSLCKNPLAGGYLRELNKIPWKHVSMNLAWICTNESCIDFLHEFPMQTDDLECISANPSALHLISEFEVLQKSSYIYYNPYASFWYGDLKEHIKVACANTDDLSIAGHKDVSWEMLSINPFFTTFLLENHMDKIDWKRFNMNESKEAVDFLSRHPEHIIWEYLSVNSHAINILRDNKSRIYWTSFLDNHRFHELIEAIEIHRSHISIVVQNEAPIAISLMNMGYALHELYRNPSIFK